MSLIHLLFKVLNDLFCTVVFADNVTSDNRSNLVSDDSGNLVASRFTEWYLNLSLSPWCGGFFERENVRKKCKGFINQGFKE